MTRARAPQMILELLIGACAVSAGSGLPGLMLPRRSSAGQVIAVGMMVIASVGGVFTALLGMGRQATQSVMFIGVMPECAFHFRFDALSGFFLVPVFLAGAASSVYGLQYWKQTEHARTGRRL